MTGQEWPETRRLVEAHLLPLMAAAKVRYIQVARRGPVEADGIDILSDTRTPNRLHLVGAWTLANEMFDGGTLPQTAGDRLCSLHCTKQADTPYLVAVTANLDLTSSGPPGVRDINRSVPPLPLGRRQIERSVA